MGMCMKAPFLAGATLVIVHLDRREVGGESEGYARCRRCRVASCSFECKGIPVPGMRLGLPKACVRNAFTCAATPGPYMA